MYPPEKIKLVERHDDDRDDIPVHSLPDKAYQLEMSDQTKRKVMQGYYASISFMDAQVGRVIAGLKALNLEKDMIVIFMSDHGYQMGAHDLWMKYDLFEGSSHAPLIISVPGSKTKGQKSDSLVEYVDIYPTINALTVVNTPDAVMGTSLTPILKDASTKRYRYTIRKEGQKGVEFYDYESDPGEFTNLAGKKDYAEIELKMKTMLAQRRTYQH